MNALTRKSAYALLAAAFLALLLAGCATEEPPAPSYSATQPVSDAVAVVVPDLSENARAGERTFNANCVLCHGPNASGTGLGPPLVHQIYEPGHHQDFTIQSAVRNGVPAHHWPFGNMPPVPAVSDEDIPNIICYIRELQRANGIIAPGADIAAC
ncbi:MAG: cytochrome c [Chloroflexota bacterium]|nr:cytochrome c [Chloroflexota bacterium]MDE2961899.1 cytochrome c [Chloroflexota bacterium]